ncbi:hypothetical protein [Vogesella oryzae]|uniref:hypothetical protein n=1 Tax=Vogesella oryzae TaxID=1735285 RepID=UPI0015822A71|nr:hypothetical protein [Vogesella oryzae]
MKPSKIADALRAANPASKPRQPAYTGTGHWLYWHSPSGEMLPIGVAIHLNGVTYRQIAEHNDIQQTVAALWGETVAWQLGKLLDNTTTALYDKTGNLPEGISAEAIELCQGDNPAQILDRLWRHGVADSLLLKKKPPSQLAERSISGSNPEAVPDEPAENTRDAAASAVVPPKRGGHGQ